MYKYSRNSAIFHSFGIIFCRHLTTMLEWDASVLLFIDVRYIVFLVESHLSCKSLDNNKRHM